MDNSIPPDFPPPGVPDKNQPPPSGHEQPSDYEKETSSSTPHSKAEFQKALNERRRTAYEKMSPKEQAEEFMKQIEQAFTQEMKRELKKTRENLRRIKKEIEENG